MKGFIIILVLLLCCQTCIAMTYQSVVSHKPLTGSRKHFILKSFVNEQGNNKIFINRNQTDQVSEFVDNEDTGNSEKIKIPSNEHVETVDGKTEIVDMGERTLAQHNAEVASSDNNGEAQYKADVSDTENKGEKTENSDNINYSRSSSEKSSQSDKEISQSIQGDGSSDKIEITGKSTDIDSASAKENDELKIGPIDEITTDSDRIGINDKSADSSSKVNNEIKNADEVSSSDIMEIKGGDEKKLESDSITNNDVNELKTGKENIETQKSNSEDTNNLAATNENVNELKNGTENVETQQSSDDTQDKKEDDPQSSTLDNINEMKNDTENTEEITPEIKNNEEEGKVNSQESVKNEMKNGTENVDTLSTDSLPAAQNDDNQGSNLYNITMGNSETEGDSSTNAHHTADVASESSTNAHHPVSIETEENDEEMVHHHAKSESLEDNSEGVDLSTKTTIGDKDSEVKTVLSSHAPHHIINNDTLESDKEVARHVSKNENKSDDEKVSNKDVDLSGTTSHNENSVGNDKENGDLSSQKVSHIIDNQTLGSDEEVARHVAKNNDEQVSNKNADTNLSEINSHNEKDFSSNGIPSMDKGDVSSKKPNKETNENDSSSNDEKTDLSSQKVHHIIDNQTLGSDEEVARHDPKIGNKTDDEPVSSKGVDQFGTTSHNENSDSNEKGNGDLSSEKVRHIIDNQTLRSDEEVARHIPKNENKNDDQSDIKLTEQKAQVNNDKNQSEDDKNKKHIAYHIIEPNIGSKRKLIPSKYVKKMIKNKRAKKNTKILRKKSHKH